MVELANEFSWSRSRDATFQDCRRKYFYQYYGAWGGWDPGAPTDVRRLYVQDMGARDDELARWISDLMCSVPLPTATAVIRGLNDWNGVGALALCTVPTLLLRSALRPQRSSRVPARTPWLHARV